MRIAHFLFLAVATFAASSRSLAQDGKPTFRYQKSFEFEVVSSGDAHVLTTEDCLGLKFLTVYIVPRAATEKRISEISKDVAGTFPNEYDLIITFTSDRRFPEVENYDEDSEEERSYFKALRGYYFRSHAKGLERLFAFPTGTSRKELDQLIDGSDN